MDTLQTQGNLQTTGKLTDMAIQGNGFFLVGSGKNVSYTRDGSFDLDSDGVLVNPANGLKLLGYVADQNGVIDSTQQITNDSVLKIPVGTLTSVKQTTHPPFRATWMPVPRCNPRKPRSPAMSKPIPQPSAPQPTMRWAMPIPSR